MNIRSTPIHKLAALKEEAERLQRSLDFAQKDLARKQHKDSTASSEQRALAANWLKQLEKRVADNALNIQTIEVGIAREKALAKPCMTASGKRIRP